jgi:hypothetical protein
MCLQTYFFKCVALLVSPLSCDPPSPNTIGHKDHQKITTDTRVVPKDII